MNAGPTGVKTSALSVVGSIVLAINALFFDFGGVGFAVVALAAVAGQAKSGDLASIIGISLFSFAVAGASIFGIVALNRRR